MPLPRPPDPGADGDRPGRAAGVRHGDEFAELGNLDTYADTNNLVVPYPQAIAGSIPDTRRVLGPAGLQRLELRGHERPQKRAITAMVHAPGG